MAFIQMTFKVSEEIALGLANGNYRLFGAVVRDNSGRVVKMLDPILTKVYPKTKNLKVVAVALAVVVVVGGTIYVCSRFTRKARLGRRLAIVDRAIQTTIREHPSELTRDDLCRIRASIDEFLRVTQDQIYSGVNLSLPTESSRMLIAFADALRSFSAQLNALSHSAEPVPNLAFSPKTPELVPVLEAIRTQLAYQERNWPTQA